MVGEHVGVSDSADEDELGGERADAGELLQVSKCILVAHRSQLRAGERAVLGCDSEGSQLIDLSSGEP